MQSKEHAKEKARARPIKKDDKEGHKETSRQQALKRKVHAIKHELKRKTRRNENPEECTKLEEQLQDLTLQHGYGKLPLTGIILLPRGMRFAPNHIPE